MISEIKTIIKRGLINAVIFCVMYIEQNFSGGRRLKAANSAKSKLITFAARLFRGCDLWVCDNIVKRRTFSEITTRETQRKDITHRKRRRARQVKAVKLSVFRGYISGLLVARQNRVEIYSAARRITAIERALRAL